MDTSKFYSKEIGKVFKKNHDKQLDEYKNELKTVFINCFNYLSKDISEEIYYKFVTDSQREFKEALYNMVNIFELFEENYDLENDPLNQEEWDFIKILINESSDDLDIDLIKYIMQVILDLSHL
jgi:hypothetical protein